MLVKNIVLCADDYGLNDQVDQGILQLITLQRLSATSCMVTFPHWLVRAKHLKTHVNQVDIGLHFNLTEGEALTGFPSLIDSTNHFFSIKELIMRCFARKINKQDVINELNAQLDQFESALQMLPNYIDGHQHIQHLPVIREALLEVYHHRLRAHRVYLRSVKLPYSQTIRARDLKTFIIQLTGAYKFAQLLKQENIPYNQSFAGFYDFNPTSNYGKLFQGFLSICKNGGLIMCHPGLLNSQEIIGEARFNELQYLESEQFLNDCQAMQVRICRFNALTKE